MTTMDGFLSMIEETLDRHCPHSLGKNSEGEHVFSVSSGSRRKPCYFIKNKTGEQWLGCSRREGVMHMKIGFFPD